MTAAPSRLPSIVFFAFILAVAACVILPRAFGFLPGVAGLIGLAILMLRPDRPALSWAMMRPVLWPVAGVIALAGCSALWAIDAPEALERTGKIAAVLAGGVALYALAVVLPAARLARLWWVLPAVVAVLAVFLSVEYHTNFSIYRLLRDIPADAPLWQAVLNRSCVALCLMALPALVMLYSGLRWRGMSRAAALAGGGLLILPLLPVLASTDSQSAQLSFVLGVVVLLIAPAQKRGLWIAVAALIAGGLMAAPWLAQYLFSLAPKDPAAIDQFGHLIMKSNFLPRLELWDFVSRHALQSPWIGYGIEATRNVPAFDTQQIYQPGVTLLHPHNAALQIWIEFGALGTTLAAAGVVALCLMLSRLRTQPARRMALALLVAIVMIGVVGYGLWQGWWIGLLTVLAALAAMTARMIAAHRIP